MGIIRNVYALRNQAWSDGNEMSILRLCGEQGHRFPSHRRRQSYSAAQGMFELSKRFTTYEIIESLPIIVVKKDKSREAFDRNKLLNGMLRACQKRQVSIETLEKAVDEIETQIQNSLDREVTATRIGEYAMEKLKDIDEVAYVRFASVYRQFKDINSFHEEISRLMDSDDGKA